MDGQTPAGSRWRIAQTEVDRLRQTGRAESLDVRSILEPLLTLLSSLSQEAGVRIAIVTPSVWPAVVADPMMLRQALLNLLSHALDVIRGDLLIAARPAGKNLQLDIVESPRHTPVASPAPVARGGVGLSVATELIEAQGGQIETEIDAGRWRAHLLLPTADATTVLIIDDNYSIIELFRRYLARYDILVVSAADGERALAMASELRPQAIILDVMMPHQDGWQILEGLKGSPQTQHIPVIVCSVLNEPRLALSMGASDYITKPVSQLQLLEALRRHLVAISPRG
jgi:CheY-like chemotaxis protein